MYLKWENVSFYVPSRKSGEKYKKILQNQNGYVQPGESVAIMGPSGSGKTSLLNILAGRSVLSKGSKYEGILQVNSCDFNTSDFGKIGAFVQQDDVLIDTMTPAECFRFALKMTQSGISDKNIEVRVRSMIDILKLNKCQNTLIGGMLMKGISGGERKRTSIGYELIKNPKLLLLDEPTSGLDSHTSLGIVKLMKNEANRGMTILATIH